MDNEDTTPVETESTEPVETPNDTPNDSANEAVDSPEPQAPEGASVGPEEPVSEEDGEEDDPVLNYQPQQYQAPQLDFSGLPTDEAGNILPEAFSQAMVQRDQMLLQQARAQVQDEMMQLRQEERLWNQAEKVLPQIASDKNIRGLVQNIRYGIIASGKNATPKQAAEQVKRLLGETSQQARTQAKESVAIQRSAQLDTSSVQSSVRSNRSDLHARIASRDTKDAEVARQELLQQWISDGTIKTGK